MFYKVLKVIVKPIFYLIFGIKVVHKERLRYEGGMILIANHRSNFDPIFMHLVVKPKVQLMAKQELFKKSHVALARDGSGRVSSGTGPGGSGGDQKCL